MYAFATAILCGVIIMSKPIPQLHLKVNFVDVVKGEIRGSAVLEFLKKAD